MLQVPADCAIRSGGRPGRVRPDAVTLRACSPRTTFASEWYRLRGSTNTRDSPTRPSTRTVESHCASPAPGSTAENRAMSRFLFPIRSAVGASMRPVLGEPGSLIRHNLRLARVADDVGGTRRVAMSTPTAPRRRFLVRQARPTPRPRLSLRHRPPWPPADGNPSRRLPPMVAIIGSWPTRW